MKTNALSPQDAELEQFKQEWFALAKKYEHRLSDETHFYATFFNEEKAKLEIKENSHHNPTPPFRVIFTDGTQIPEKGHYLPGSRILVAFIQKVGVEKVDKAMILATGNHKILSRDLDAIAKYNPLYVDKGWFAITKNPNSEKIVIIREIIKQCGVTADVKKEKLNKTK